MSILARRERAKSHEASSRHSQVVDSRRDRRSLSHHSQGLEFVSNRSSSLSHHSQGLELVSNRSSSLSHHSQGLELVSNRSSSSSLSANRPRTLVKSRHTILSASGGFFIAYFILGSKLLAIPFTLLGASLPYLIQRHRRERAQAQLATLWPELLDHMISGLRSGLSIAETLAGLARRGPEIS